MWGSFATDLAALRKLIMFTGGVLTENQKQLSSLHQSGEKKNNALRLEKEGAKLPLGA